MLLTGRASVQIPNTIFFPLLICIASVLPLNTLPKKRRGKYVNSYCIDFRLKVLKYNHKKEIHQKEEEEEAEAEAEEKELKEKNCYEPSLPIFNFTPVKV